MDDVALQFDTAYSDMSKGWGTVVERFAVVIWEQD